MSHRSQKDDFEAPALRYGRTGILVIHGIGEQNPYQTIDHFARGLFRYLVNVCGRKARLDPREIAHQDWTEVAMRIKVAPSEFDDGADLDIHEYYWAPYTEDKINLRQTLAWLLRTDLTPLRYLSNNLQEMAAMPAEKRQAEYESKLPVNEQKTAARFLFLFWREIRRILFVFVPAALVIIGLMYWLGHLPQLATTLQPLLTLTQGSPPGARLVVFLGYVLAAFLTVFVLQSLVTWLRGGSFQKKAEAVWLLSAPVLIPSFLGASWLAQRQCHIDMTPVWKALGRPDFLKCLAVLAAAALARYFLVKFIVAVYTTADAKSKNYAARTEILKGSTAAVINLLANQEYDNVILVGHSLGSVIAYDTINEIISAMHAKSNQGEPREVELHEPALQKLTGLVTFGSPLDKIYYFFREHVRHDEAIRAQILSMLHSFRKVRSYRDYGEFTFHYSLPCPPLTWLNAWSPLDPVSAKLSFYNVDVQKGFWYWIPILAHLSYWRDPKFYEFISRHLLFAEPEDRDAATSGHADLR